RGLPGPRNGAGPGPREGGPGRLCRSRRGHVARRFGHEQRSRRPLGRYDGMVMNFQLSVRYFVALSICACVSCTGGVDGALTAAMAAASTVPAVCIAFSRTGRAKPFSHVFAPASEKTYATQQRAAAGWAASLLIASL